MSSRVRARRADRARLLGILAITFLLVSSAVLVVGEPSPAASRPSKPFRAAATTAAPGTSLPASSSAAAGVPAAPGVAPVRNESTAPLAESTSAAGCAPTCSATIPASPTAAPTPARPVPSDGDASSWEELTSANGEAPSPRQGAAVGYDAAPGEQALILFGGKTSTGYDQDTWEYSDGNWTVVQSAYDCDNLVVSCPPPAAFASMVYIPTTEQMMLFGGIQAGPNGYEDQVPFSTVYFFINGSWYGNYVSVPSGLSLVDVSMSWYYPDSCVLIFGGFNPSSGEASNATWCFDPVGSTWTELSGPGPSARWGAAMTNTSWATILLFGGDSASGLLDDTWEFAWGGWREVTLGEDSATPSARAFAGFAVSPSDAFGVGNPNDLAFLYGGIVGPDQTNGGTWAFSGALPPESGGASGNWSVDLSTPSPPGAESPVFATDLATAQVIEFGGLEEPNNDYTNETWAYFHLVDEVVTNASEISVDHPVTLTDIALGGQQPYTYVWSGLPQNCSGANVSVIVCTPTVAGLFNISVNVSDMKGRTAASNVTLQVDPADAYVHFVSEYSGYFFTGIAINDTIGVSGGVWGESPTSVDGSIGGDVLNFTANGSYFTTYLSNTGALTPGLPIDLVVHFSNWTLRSESYLKIVQSPSWLYSFLDFPGTSVTTVPSATGTAAWNNSWGGIVQMYWPLPNLISLVLPVAGFGGDYSLLPGVGAWFNVSSKGDLTLQGTFGLNPSITVGSVQLSANLGKLFPGLYNFTFSLALGGTFSVVPTVPHQYTVNWSSAYIKAGLGVTATVNIPVVGWDTPFGPLGLVISIKFKPSILMTAILEPTSVNSSFLGLGVAIANLITTIGLQITLALQLQLGKLASLGIQGQATLSILLADFGGGLAGVYLNGTVSLFATVFFLTISYTIVKGNIYTYTPGDRPFSQPAATDVPSVDQPWQMASRSYNTSAYERLVWNATNTSGPALEDLYPTSTLAIANSASGALLAYSSDNVSLPEADGLELRGLAINTSDRAVVPVALPAVPGAISVDPSLLGLSDGAVEALWTSVPDASLDTMVPADISGFHLEAAEDQNGSWSSPAALPVGGYPQGYALGTCSGAPAAAVLVSDTLATNGSTPERLLVVDLPNGTVRSNVSVEGLTGLTAFNCDDGWASAENASGNATVLLTVNGRPYALDLATPSGDSLQSAAPVAGNPSALALLYRGSPTDLAVVFDPYTETTLATVTVPESTTSIAASVAGTGFDVFAGEPNEVLGFATTLNGTWALPSVAAPNLTAIGLALSHGGVVLYDVSRVGTGNASSTTLGLEFFGFTPAKPPTTTTKSPPTVRTLAGVCSFAGLGCAGGEVVFGVVLAFLVLVGIVLFFGRRRAVPPADASSLPPSERDP